MEFTLEGLLDRSELEATAARGEGVMSLRLDKSAGPVRALRESRIALARPDARDRVLRATMELRREPVRRS